MHTVGMLQTIPPMYFELFRFKEYTDEHNFCNRSKSSALSVSVSLCTL